MENNFFEEELKKIQKEKTNENPNKNAKKKIRYKKRVTRVVLLGSLAVLLAGVISLASYYAFGKKKNNNSGATPTPTPIYKVDDLGFKKEDVIIESGNEFGVVTGDIKKENLTEKDGVIYKDKEAANKSDKVGTAVTDDKNGTLTVKPNGEVFEKDKGYEIKDETGKVINSGSNVSGTPEGYVKDENLDKVVKEEDVNKFVYVDADYYDKNGNLVWPKGAEVLKETLEKIKADTNLTTVKPVTATPSATAKPTPTPNVDSLGGVVNKNGTYTIYGTTYMDKATFEAFVIDENSAHNFGFYNGVVYPVEVIKEMTKSNTK